MNLYVRLINIYPELRGADLDTLGISLVDRADGQGPRIERWAHPSLPEPTPEQIAASSDTDPLAYRTERAAAYPPVGDQLDALFKAGLFPPELAAQIQAVKDAHPKPGA